MPPLSVTLSLPAPPTIVDVTSISVKVRRSSPPFSSALTRAASASTTSLPAPPISDSTAVRLVVWPPAASVTVSLPAAPVTVSTPSMFSAFVPPLSVTLSLPAPPTIVAITPADVKVRRSSPSFSVALVNVASARTTSLPAPPTSDSRLTTDTVTPSLLKLSESDPFPPSTERDTSCSESPVRSMGSPLLVPTITRLAGMPSTSLVTASIRVLS